MDNSPGDLYADFELYSGTSTAVIAGSGVELYLVRTVDDTNWEDTSTDGYPLHGYVGTFPLLAVLTTQRMVIPFVRVPPTSEFKCMVLNASSYALATTGYIGSPTLKAYFYREQVTT